MLFAYAKTKTQISCAVTAQLLSAFVSAIRIVQSIYYLNPKCQASSHLMCVYSLVLSDLVENPKVWFSHYEAHLFYGGFRYLN